MYKGIFGLICFLASPHLHLCSAEILSSPGGTAKVIQLMYKGILDGQASAGRFLELLAGSKDEAVQASASNDLSQLVLC